MCDFLLVINSNLGPISHRLATIHPWQTTTDRQTNRLTNGRQPYQKLDRYLSTVG